MILENGFLLNDRYRILDILGLGEMGVVYRAVDEKLDICVAIKEGRVLSEEDARQFEHGARLLASLRHPNLTRVFDYFVIDGEGQYLVMEYIEGENLYQWGAHTVGITEMEALQIGIEICNALTYLHSQDPPISHLGIRPENIRFTPLGEIILVDLGLVKINQAKKATTITVRAPSGSFTPPELFGEGSPDPRSDIFSLGATLYAALAGFPPEDSLDRATGKSQLSPLRNYMPHLSRQTVLAIEKALSLRFEDRWQSAAEMRDALIKALGALPGEKQLNAILSTATDGIIVINESGIIQTFNRGAERIFGYSEREAIGKNVNLLMPAPDSQKHQGYIDAYFHKQKQNSNVVSRINQREGKRKNGEVFPLSLSVSFVELPDKKLFTGIIRDISEQVRIENELKLAKERLENELSLAAKIQANLMERTIPEFEHFDFNAVNIPARYLSGDFYDVKALNPNTYQLVLGDLAGKGIPAALLAFSTISLLKAESDIVQSPKDLLELLNQTLYSELDQAEVFITLFIAHVDLATNQVNYASAGHGEAFLWRYAEKKIVQLQATGLPVGVEFTETYREKQCNLRPGDLLIIYSDGITEATNSLLEQFGFEQLAEIINTNYHLTASTISDKIIDQVKQFSEGHEQDDDITLLVMKSLPRTIELEIPGKIAILDQVLSTIHEYAANYSIDFANEVELACSEALTNIIKYAYQSKPGMVQIKIHLIPEGIAFDFYDQGESFELDLVSEPNPEDLYESGYGIFIMKQIFDEVFYEFDKESGNHWRLNKLFREK